MTSKPLLANEMPEGPLEATAIDPALLRDLTNQIYDCASAPEELEKILKIICRIGNFQFGLTYGLDHQNRFHVRQWVGTTPEWQRHYFSNQTDYEAELESLGARFFAALPVDEPQVWSRHLPQEAYQSTRYFNEWMRPQGIVDILHRPAPRQTHRFGALIFGRHERSGPFDERAIGFAKLLLPHLQRAFTLSNLLEEQTWRANSLRAAIRDLLTGIMILAQDGTILEANLVAEQLIAGCPVSCVVDGRLTAGDREHAEKLRQALLAVSKGEAVLLNDARPGGNKSGRVVCSCILPLSSGDFRPNSGNPAVGVLLITPDEEQHARLPKAESLSVVYELTAAETRVAEALADGKTSLDAALALGISEGTIRSHLTRIYAKTGVSRQAQLVSLMNRLTLPLRDAIKPHEP